MEKYRKKVRIKMILLALLALTAVAGSLIGINRFMTALPDWAVRAAGIILMVCLVVLVFLTVRVGSENKATE